MVPEQNEHENDHEHDDEDDHEHDHEHVDEDEHDRVGVGPRARSRFRRVAIGEQRSAVFGESRPEHREVSAPRMKVHLRLSCKSKMLLQHGRAGMLSQQCSATPAIRAGTKIVSGDRRVTISQSRSAVFGESRSASSDRLFSASHAPSTARYQPPE
jgi:hypothetical protein